MYFRWAFSNRKIKRIIFLLDIAISLQTLFSSTYELHNVHIEKKFIKKNWWEFVNLVGNQKKVFHHKISTFFPVYKKNWKFPYFLKIDLKKFIKQNKQYQFPRMNTISTTQKSFKTQDKYYEIITIQFVLNDNKKIKVLFNSKVIL